MKIDELLESKSNDWWKNVPEFRNKKKLDKKTQKAIDLVIAYSENGEENFKHGQSSPDTIQVNKLDAALEEILKLGKCNYVGELFRGLGFPSEDLDDKDNLVAKIKSFDRKKFHPWSKKIGNKSSGIINILTGLIGTDDMLPQGVIITQTGEVGVDITKLKKFDAGDSDHNKDFDHEHEVIAPQGNFKIYGFYKFDKGTVKIVKV